MMIRDSSLLFLGNPVGLYLKSLYRVAQKSKPSPIFQNIVLKIANEIIFLHKVKV